MQKRLQPNFNRVFHRKWIGWFGTNLGKLIQSLLPVGHLRLVFLGMVFVRHSFHVVAGRRGFWEGWLAAVEVREPVVEGIVAILSARDISGHD